MKWFEKFVEKCIEPKPKKTVRRTYTKSELLRIVEAAEQKQLAEIFKENGLI